MKKVIWIVTITIFAGKMLFAMAINAQGILLTSFINTFHLESSAQGMPVAATNVGILLSMLLAVPLAAKIGKPGLFAMGLGIIAFMLVCVGVSQSALWLIAGYAIMGFGFGFVDTTASTIIADMHEGKRAALMMGLTHAAFGTGGILSPIVMKGALNAGADWRSVIMVLGAVIGVVFLFTTILFQRKQDQLPKNAGKPARLTVSAIQSFIQKPGNLWIVVCTAFYCAHQSTLYLWIDRILGVGFNSTALAATALSLFWIGTVVSRLVTPLLRLKTIPYLKLCMITTAILLGLSMLSGSALFICIAVGLSGLLGGATIPMALYEITSRNPKQSMVAVTAVLLCMSLFNMICGPFVGFVVGHTTLIAGLAVSAIAALCCGMSTFMIKEHVES